jgi:hypothetical protein
MSLFISTMNSLIVSGCALTNSPKPWAVADFQRYRPYITNFVDSNIVPLIESRDYEVRRILIHGEVKSGKREIVEYIARRDHGSEIREHIFISAFHRKADESQRRELEQHNLKVFSIISVEVAKEALRYINERVSQGKKLILHADECDYGTGSRQSLKFIYSRIKENRNIFTILYSATPEELLFSQDITQNEEDENFIGGIYEQGIQLYYIPPETYCGAKKFLDEKLVENAIPFFKFKKEDGTCMLSTQGKKIIADAKENLRNSKMEKVEATYLYNKYINENNIAEAEKYLITKEKKIRNVIVLRLTYKTYRSSQRTSQRSNNRSIEEFLNNSHLFPELADVNIIADKSDLSKYTNNNHNISCETVNWSNKSYWDNKQSDKLIVIVHEQTSTRSTEWEFHDRVFATHDYRPTVSYGTIAQAQLRVAHYSSKYGEFQSIRVYGHLKTFQLAAKEITFSEYLNDDWQKKQLIRDHWIIDDTVKYKYNNVWMDALITAYNDDDTYNLSFIQNDSLITKTNVRKSNIKKDSENKKFNIINTKTGEIHPEYSEEYNDSTADKILDDLGCNIKTDLSSRVKGKAKIVLKIKTLFIKCNENNIEIEIQTHIKNNMQLPDDVRQHNFNVSSLFDHYIVCEDGQRRCTGTIRANRKIYTYEDMKKERWGFSLFDTGPRLTVCYNGNILGVCLRYTNGDREEVTTLSSYKSMYQPL